MLKNKSPYEEIKSAIANQKVEIVKTLIASHPIMLDGKDIHGKSLLQTSITFFCPEITLALLCSKKVDVNHRDSQGVTALVSALISAKYDAIKLLLQAGATLDTKQKNDSLALAIAIRKNPEIAKLLEQSIQGKLEPLPHLQIDSKSTDTPSLSSVSNINATKNQGSVAAPIELILSSNNKSAPLWQNITGSLKQRIKRQNTSAASIEMSPSPHQETPTYPPSSNHPHAD